MAGYAALNIYARGRNAVSSEAKAAQEAATAVVQSVERSQALFGDKAAAISQLRALANEYSDPGWDGDEAAPINSLAVLRAESFLRALPIGIRMPEFAPEPDGSISLDWIRSRTRFLTLSVGASDRLSYAWVDGTDRGHGVARFDGAGVPERIMEEISAVTSHGNATLRAA